MMYVNLKFTRNEIQYDIISLMLHVTKNLYYGTTGFCSSSLIFDPFIVGNVKCSEKMNIINQ